jgi:superfamily I DNA/RNA helicase
MAINLPSTLTDPQREAILHQDSPLLIIAGPGSGKTEVISWRVAHLVTSGRAGPEQILALTFTNKAALGLKDRIQSKLPGVNAELMQISTFHSFCADLLRRYPRPAGLPNGYAQQVKGEWLQADPGRQEFVFQGIRRQLAQVTGGFRRVQVSKPPLLAFKRQAIRGKQEKDE